jgi:hypothetical protein
VEHERCRALVVFNCLLADGVISVEGRNRSSRCSGGIDVNLLRGSYSCLWFKFSLSQRPRKTKLSTGEFRNSGPLTYSDCFLQLRGRAVDQCCCSLVWGPVESMSLAILVILFTAVIRALRSLAQIAWLFRV